MPGKIPRMAFLTGKVTSRLIDRKIMLGPGEMGRCYQPEGYIALPSKGNLAGPIDLLTFIAHHTAPGPKSLLHQPALALGVD
jgi:hypothetical protein